MGVRDLKQNAGWVLSRVKSGQTVLDVQPVHIRPGVRLSAELAALRDDDRR